MVKALVKFPGEDFKIVEVEADRVALEELLGGEISCYGITTDSMLVILKQRIMKPYNVKYLGFNVRGPLMVIGRGNGKWRDVPQPFIDGLPACVEVNTQNEG